METLLGMRVRDRNGRTGYIVGAGLGGVEIDWTDRGVLTPQRGSVSASEASRFEVLTLTEGWMPMGDVLREAGQAPKTLVEDLESLLVESDSLEEAKKKAAAPARGKSLEKKARERRRARSRGKEGGGHNPFKTKKKLGPGPRRGTNTQTNKWKCTCPTPYRCMCRAGKRRKTVKIGRAYKKDYNHEYKRWRSKQKF